MVINHVLAFNGVLTEHTFLGSHIGFFYEFIMIRLVRNRYDINGLDIDVQTGIAP